MTNPRGISGYDDRRRAVRISNGEPSLARGRTRKRAAGLAGTVCVAVLALGFVATDASAIGGQVGLEFAIDAPWRIEPVHGTGGLEYGWIPITIAFHDAIFDHHRSTKAAVFLKRIHVGSLVRVEVEESDLQRGKWVSQFAPTQLREIEWKDWISTVDEEPPMHRCTPNVDVSRCRLDISGTAEWHAALWYKPRGPVAPGRDIQLRITVETEYGGEKRRWINQLVVHAGEAPLPRFSEHWLYGDLHYHSQMTDNEGESAYTYRNVARALGASGLDFVFATDHGSGGVQIDGAVEAGGRKGIEARDLNIRRFQAAKQSLYAGDGANEAIVKEAVEFGLARPKAGFLPQVFMGVEIDSWPEMSYEEQRANAIAFGAGASYPWADVEGCWADKGTACKSLYSAWHPEADGGAFSGCGGIPVQECVDRARPHQVFIVDAPLRQRFRVSKPLKISKRGSTLGIDWRFLVLDEQGAPIEEKVPVYGGVIEDTVEFLSSVIGSFEVEGSGRYSSRQHLVYFPFDAQPNNAAGWLDAATGKFGGGQRTIGSLAGEIPGKGRAFLAHPVSGRKPNGAGPNMVPYSRVSLDQAWASPGILGLQLWNENDRLLRNSYHHGGSAPVGGANTNTFNYRVPFGFPARVGEYERWPTGWFWPTVERKANHLWEELYHGTYIWDVYLRKGLDPHQTRGLAWLQPGEPRKWFAAGGSDSHGDLNYRRHGRPDLDPSSASGGIFGAGVAEIRGRFEQWTDNPVTDTAIGKPRNLVFVGPPQGAPSAQLPGVKRYTNRQIIDALERGQFSVTDGPALRVAIDRNRNGLIDDTDFQMGTTFHLYPGEKIPVLVEWWSTPEFGPIQRVDLYVGNRNETFAPDGHLAPSYFRRPTTGWPTGPWPGLRLPVANSQAMYHGVGSFLLDPEQFGIKPGSERFYVRAAARAASNNYDAFVFEGANGSCPESSLRLGHCGDRIALSNPVWGVLMDTCQQDPLAIDTDADGMGDACDPCPQAPGTKPGTTCGSLPPLPYGCTTSCVGWRKLSG